MNDFFESKFIKDLEEGNLPTVEVSINTLSIRNLCIALLLTSVIIIMINYMAKKVL